MDLTFCWNIFYLHEHHETVGWNQLKSYSNTLSKEHRPVAMSQSSQLTPRKSPLDDMLWRSPNWPYLSVFDMMQWVGSVGTGWYSYELHGIWYGFYLKELVSIHTSPNLRGLIHFIAVSEFICFVGFFFIKNCHVYLFSTTWNKNS